MKSKIKTAHINFMRLLESADLDPGDIHNLIRLWDNVLKAVVTGDNRRIRKTINDFCRAINKRVN